MIDTSKLKGRIVEKFGTQGKFAEYIGRTQTYVSYVINGKTQLNQSDVIAWAKALDISMDDIGEYFFSLILTNVSA